MNITYDNKTIEFYNFELPKQVIVSLSGGLDSAAAMYLTCKHFPDIEIIPITLRDLHAQLDAEAAEDIVGWMKNKFPSANIHDIEIFDFNDKDESIVSWDECDQLKEDYPEHYSTLNRVQISKIIQIDNILQGVVDNYDMPLRIDGMTLNPPVEEMKKISLRFYGMAERRRDPCGHRQTLFKSKFKCNNMYQIFGNVDKKFVADIYRQEGLMETLYPLTRSCVGSARYTQFFEKECHDCFWCYEKKWAFDLDHQARTGSI
jgi:hypothetical protein